MSAIALLLVAAQSAMVARADPEGDSQRLASCVASHVSAADTQAMEQMTALLIVDAQSTPDDVQAAFDLKRPEIYAGVAATISRLAEKDCADEVHAAAASLPTGNVFKVMFTTLGQVAASTMGPAMNRLSLGVGLELLKVIDTKVVLDIMGPTGGAPPATTPPRASSSPNGNAAPAASAH